MTMKKLAGSPVVPDGHAATARPGRYQEWVGTAPLRTSVAVWIVLGLLWFGWLVRIEYFSEAESSALLTAFGVAGLAAGTISARFRDVLVSVVVATSTVWAFMIVVYWSDQAAHVPSLQSLIQVAVYGIVFVGLGHLAGVALRRTVSALWAEG
jgi:hypothetical protein